MNNPERVDKANAASDHSSRESDSPLPATPSAQQSAFEQAAQAIVCGSGSGSGAATSFGSEVRNVEKWALQHGTLIPDSCFRDLVPISNHTSEHEVFYRAADSRAIKRTWPGVYGQIPVALAGKLDRQNAAPSGYLTRMALHIAVFGSDLRLGGVTISDKPSMIIGQPAGQPHKPDNFIRTSEGLIAIDLQMAQFNAADLSACGLTSGPSAPVLFIPR